MNPFALAFLVVNAVALFILPRRWAPLPLLVGTCYMTLGQGIKLGPFHFPIIRLLIASGLIRIIIRRERLAGRMNSLDWLMLVWSVWALMSSIFHKYPPEALVFRLGLIYNACGIYFLLRVFCQSPEDIKDLCRITAILLIPVAVLMLYEQVALNNLFSELDGVSKIPQIREGTIRASGPFLHPILAGTVGAVCLPLMVGLWNQHRKTAFAGIAACLTIVFLSGSSGPMISAMAAVAALYLWRYRQKMQLVRWLAVFIYIGLDVVMKAPAYYVIYRFDIAGGSTGWHRARLIETAIQHLNEWWLGGTDYTRHWMPTGVSWSQDHTDITNHYLQLGVLGGLPLMLLFIIILIKGFSFVGQIIRQEDRLTLEFRFFIWALGASLFAHAATCISVSYFDQSFMFIYLTLAAVGSAWSSIRTATVADGVAREAIDFPWTPRHSELEKG